MKLTVVILNWNGKNDTVACLASLQNVYCGRDETLNFGGPQSGSDLSDREECDIQVISPTNDHLKMNCSDGRKNPMFHSDRSIDIVLVDNGSSDDSVAAITQQFPRIVLLETGKNLGYAGGNNVGIEYALKQGADLVLLLNNDTIVDRHFIAALLKSVQEHKNVGIFGAYPLRFSDPEKLDHLGGRWNSQTASFDLIGLGADKGFKTDQPLDYVCGCSILVRREVFEAIGLLEPTFFLFWEEADFCMRAKKAGFDIGISYEATLLHKVSASFVGGTPHKTYFWWRGRCLWMERNCSKEEKERLYQTVVLPELRHLLKLRIIKSCQFLLLRLLQKKNLSQKKGKLLQYRAALEGYRDFSKSSFGSGPSWLFKRE